MKLTVRNSQSDHNKSKPKRNTKRLGDVATVVSGGTPSRSVASYWGGSIPWIKTAQIQNCKIRIEDVDEWITDEGLQNSSARMVPAGTILMAMYGQGKTRGQVGILEIDATVNQACAAILLKSNVSRDFVYQQLLSQYSRIRGMSNVGGQENLSAELIKEIPIHLPPLPEQVAIADLLSTWDAAIEKTERLFAAKEKRFGELVRNTLARRLTGSRRKRIEQLFEVVTRKNKVGETNVLTTSAQHGLVSQLDYFKKSVSAEDVSGYYLLKKGEFAYNRSSSNGYPYGAIKRLESYEQGVLSTLYLCFAIKPGSEVDSDFVAHAFEAGVLNHQLVRVCQEGARSHGLLNITKSDFFGLELGLPPLSRQQELAALFNLAWREVELQRGFLKNYQAQKRGLMQKLLTGAWQVNASELNI